MEKVIGVLKEQVFFSIVCQFYRMGTHEHYNVRVELRNMFSSRYTACNWKGGGDASEIFKLGSVLFLI